MGINKVANAFYENAEPIEQLPKHAKRATYRYKKKHCGLWVGGKITISDNDIIFKANLLNKELHRELQTIIVPAHEIKSVTYKFGWVTGIVIVKHSKGELRFRCYGAKKVVNELNSYIK